MFAFFTILTVALWSEVQESLNNAEDICTTGCEDKVNFLESLKQSSSVWSSASSEEKIKAYQLVCEICENTCNSVSDQRIKARCEAARDVATANFHWLVILKALDERVTSLSNDITTLPRSVTY
jgi:hypothetical protein